MKRLEEPRRPEVAVRVKGMSREPEPTNPEQLTNPEEPTNPELTVRVQGTIMVKSRPEIYQPVKNLPKSPVLFSLGFREPRSILSMTTKI